MAHDDERIAVLGGTFSPIHNGHRALPHVAFQTASHDGDGDGHVTAALTSSALAGRTRGDPSHVDLVVPFEERRAVLEAEFGRMAGAYTATHEAFRLEDTGGPAATRPAVHALVISLEAKAQHRAYELNERRRVEGLRPLEINIPPFVVVEDGERISSTRIRKGRADDHGRVLGSTAGT